MKRFLTYIDNQLGRIFEKIQKTAWIDTQSLAYFRIFIGIFMLSHYLPEWIWLGEVPQGFFSPHIFSMAGLSDGFMSKNFYLGLDLLNILFFCLMTLGIRTRISLFVLFIINYTGFSYEFGFGKIDHEIHLYLITLLTLSFTNCGTQVALLKDSVLKPKFQQWALTLLCIYIAFGFFTAGLPKFIKWVDFDSNEIGFLDWFYKGYYNYDRTHLLADMVFKTPKLVFEIADYLAPTIELLAFVFLLWGRRAWRIYLLVISIFHMGNMLLLNIEFVLNVTCYGLFLIAPFLSYIRNSLPKGRSAKILLVSLVGILAIYQLGYKFYYMDRAYAPGFFTERFILNNYISIGAWVLTIAIGIYTIKKKLYDLPQEVPV